ncbi:hypothetical protein [Desulfoluna limicola]|uniref:hypothetical protein n=1 Tax=Desulfoluna limicola TaxID=2810562 RepID=UPI001F42E424|nr:hypothetical protein [Desulfoluna limicola]
MVIKAIKNNASGGKVSHLESGLGKGYRITKNGFCHRETPVGADGEAHIIGRLTSPDFIIRHISTATTYPTRAVIPNKKAGQVRPALLFLKHPKRFLRT